jgi:hypothetical protein
MWGVALFSRRRPALLVWGMAIMAVAVGFSTISFAEWYLRDRVWYWHTAERTICPTVMVLSLALGAMALAAGLMCGRSLARALIRALLPPRLRSSLAFLWIAGRPAGSLNAAGVTLRRLTESGPAQLPGRRAPRHRSVASGRPCT